MTAGLSTILIALGLAVLLAEKLRAAMSSRGIFGSGVTHRPGETMQQTQERARELDRNFAAQLKAARPYAFGMITAGILVAIIGSLT